MDFSNLPELSFGLASLGTGILSILLAIAVLLGNPHLKENRIWALASFSVAVWSGGLGFATLAPDKRISLLWNQVFYTGGVWIPTTFVWFTSTFTRQPIKKLFLLLCTTLSGILSLVIWLKTEWFISDLVQRGPFRFWNILGPASNAFTIFFFSAMAYSIFQLYWSLNVSKLIERKKIKWITIGMTCGILGGLTNFFYDYNFDVYPFGQFLVFLYPLLFSWAVIRYQALDVRILLRKTSLLILVYSLLVILVLPLPIFIHGKIYQQLGPLAYAIVLEIIIVSTVLSLGPLIYAGIIRRGRLFHKNTLASLTHELKTPLAVIESALDILNEQTHRMNPNDTATISMIERSSTRLKVFVEDLLHVFGEGDKKRALNVSVHNIHDLVDEEVEVVRDIAKGKNISVRNRIKNNLTWPCDEERIRQTLSNLISNTVKFTEQGEIQISAMESSEALLVEIKDSGVGIAAKDLPFIFDPFFQAQTRKNTRGTGIGLTIAKTWIEAPGGKLGVDSKGLDLGTLFWFSLPR